MNFVGFDLHTNRFTCCYWDEKPSTDNPAKGRVIDIPRRRAAGYVVLIWYWSRISYLMTAPEGGV